MPYLPGFCTLFIGAMLRFLLMLVLLGSSSTLWAQQRIFTNQQHFGVDDGLPQSYITGLLQDDDGFIWLSTFDGLARYDGRGFRVFRYNPKDSDGLATSVIVGRGKLKENRVTLHFDTYLADEFNVRTFKATRNVARLVLQKIPGARPHSPRACYDTEDLLFLMQGASGIGWVNYVTAQPGFANTKNGLLKNDTVNAIAQAPDGRIFVVSEKSVQIVDTVRKTCEQHIFNTQVKDPPALTPGERERFAITWLPGDRLAVLQEQNLVIVDAAKKTGRVLPIPPPPAGNINGYGLLLVDHRGRAYFEDHGRIFRLNEKDQLDLLWENTGAPDRISAFYIDRSDVLWFSVNAQGLMKIDLGASRFESYRYKQSFTVDILNHLGINSTQIPAMWGDKLVGYFFRQTRDSSGRAYYSNNWGEKADIYQYTGTEFRPFLHVPRQATYGALIAMPNNELWAYVQEERRWYIWKKPDAIPQKLAADSITQTGVEPADAQYIGGYIWMTTYNDGLIQMDGPKTVARFSGPLPNGVMPSTLTEICADPFDKNKFWIGSRSGGLILWDVKKGLQRIYTIDDGLPNNTIYCILPDKMGNLWCSTNKGIFRFEIASGRITSFEKTDGLAGNEFNRAHKFAFPDGRLAFGGLDGYTIFNPADFNSVSAKADVPVLLTGLQINNKSQDVNVAGSIIQQSLSILSAIELPYNKNYLRFEFAALVFNQPQKIKYRFQLKGIDAGWVENGHNNIAAYSALRPGHYTFRINATDNNGLWSNRVTEIDITIRPPFWATWWAWIIYLLLAGGLVRWYLIFRDRRLKMQQTLAFEKREAVRLREMDELKDRFFSNITHEFRTPLTLIITPLEKLEKDPSMSSAAIRNIKTAQRNSNLLLGLINEFLEFSKINHGQLKLQVTTGEPARFTADCVDAFRLAAREKNIQLSFENKNVEGHFLFDKAKWEKIVGNLLSNAIKFTPANGVVTVVLSVAAEQLQLEVSDNGPGIPKDQQHKVFDRFYQVDDSAVRQHGGTGIGLALVKELVALMGGRIELNSEPGRFTRFNISVPMEKVSGTGEETKEKETLNPAIPLQNSEAPVLLIVEDNDELRGFLVETMQKHYRVLEAANGLTAWDIILQELPDMVISDVMMPGRDGFDLCKQCKSDSRTNHIGFILLTSKAAQDAVLTGLGTGADEYITKPFSLEELQLRTANLFQLKQKQREWLQARLNQQQPAGSAPVVTDPFLLQIYKEIDAKLTDADLGVDYLCRVTAMSRSTLNRKLKSLLDISPNDLIRHRRLQKAASLILLGSDISSAAYDTGFSSPSYFSQCFKEQYGLTPTDWISKQR